MRQLKYLSPSSLATYEKDAREFYLRYLADKRTPRPTQTKPMSVGSAFDAYIKSYLYKELFGVGGFEFEELFEKQVEAENRSFARAAGLHCFNVYKQSGVLVDVLKMLGSSTEVEFEIEVIRAISEDSEPVVITKEWEQLPPNTVPVLGKPDLRFRAPDGMLVTLDWKVNGYCSKSGGVTKRGYVRYVDVGILGKNHGTRHKDCIVGPGGYNVAEPFETYLSEHTDQLATYSWNNGAKVGEQSLVIIHQMVWKAGHAGIADYRGMISADYQRHLFARYRSLWEKREQLLPVEDMVLLERIAASDSGDPEFEKMFVDMTRGY